MKYVALVLILLPFLFFQQEPTFTDTFDGNPNTPQEFISPQWDVVVHHREQKYWDSPKTVAAHHSDICNPYPETHTVESSVYLCRNHIMTALDGGEYGMIYLTPSALVDFSTETARISFDVSTLRTSNRDWIDLWVIPEQDDLIMPLEGWLPDATGNPRNGIHIRMTDPGNASTKSFFFAEIVRNFQVEHTIQNQFVVDDILVPSALVRNTFQLDISKTHIRFGLPAYNKYWVDTDINPALTWNTGFVQFGHHSYNPTKDGGIPDTWHWDNITIAPFKQKQIVPISSKEVIQKNTGIIVSNPAPKNTRMRFNGYVGDYVNVAFDDNLFQKVTAQASEKPDTRDHFRTFWVDVPEGTQKITFDGPSGFLYWRIKNISLWSDTIIEETSTLTPTITDTATSTVVPTNTSTTTPTLTPTDTVVPTNTNTATPTPICYTTGTILYENEDIIIIRK